MPKNLDKYFWEGQQNLSGEFKLKRILEYASFPDLVAYPFDELKAYLDRINVDQLRTSEKRKSFMKMIKPLIAQTQTWDEVIEAIIKPYLR